MMRISSRGISAPSYLALAVLAGLSAMPFDNLLAEEQPGRGDPGWALHPASFSADEEKVVRAWFKELGNDDFDVREATVAKLVAKGPRVLPIAAEFFNDPDREIAALSKSLRAKILGSFDGFLPTDPELSAALAKPPGRDIAWSKGPVHGRGNGILVMQTIFDVCQKFHIRVELDSVGVNADYALPDGNQIPSLPDCAESARKSGSLEEVLQMLAEMCNGRGLARGDVYFITSPKKAEQLTAQRYTFDWSALELSREEAARVEKVFALFFSSSRTEMHSGSSALLVSGTLDVIQTAGRLVALLKHKSPDAVWPRPAALDDAALQKKLLTPAPLVVNADTPAQIVEAIRSHALDVNLQAPNGIISATPGDAYWSNQVEMSNLSVNFNQGDMPLGLLLRWCERRAKLRDARQAARLVYDVTPDNRIVLHVRNEDAPNAASVCGADVTFLYKAPVEFNADTDAAVRKQLRGALEDHLAVFPKMELESHFRVVRGRLLAQGPSATLRRILELVAEWRASGKAPEPPAWRTSIETALNHVVEWDGRGLTAGKVLSTLRKLGKVNLLLEDSPNQAAHFELLPQDAELLAPGKYPFKELLDELTKRAKAQWRVETGAITLTPK